MESLQSYAVLKRDSLGHRNWRVFLMEMVLMMLLCSWGNAGLILTKNKAVVIGKIQEKGTKLYISIRQGNSQIRDIYRKADVLWYVISPKVTTIYHGAQVAFKEKKYEVAKFLAERSLKEERRYQPAARRLLQYIDAAIKKEPIPGTPIAPSEGALTATEKAMGAIAGGIGGTSGGRQKRLRNVASGGRSVQNGSLLGSLRDDLLICEDDTVKPFTGEELKSAEYIIVLFAPLYDLDVREFCKKVALQRRLMESSFPGKLLFVLVANDTKADEFRQWFPQIKPPLPALRFERINGHPLLRYKQRMVEIVVLRRDGSEFARGGLKVLLKLRDELYGAGQ